VVERQCHQQCSMFQVDREDHKTVLDDPLFPAST
jgi:hypothetical protein